MSVRKVRRDQSRAITVMAQRHTDLGAFAQAQRERGSSPRIVVADVISIGRSLTRAGRDDGIDPVFAARDANWFI